MTWTDAMNTDFASNKTDFFGSGSRFSWVADNVVGKTSSNDLILDVGGAPGHLANMMTEKGRRVMVADTEPRPKELPKVITYFSEPSHKMPSVKSGSVDFVVCDHGVNYFPNIMASLREIRRVLRKPSGAKSGGRVFIVTPEPGAWENEPNCSKAATFLLASLRKAAKGEKVSVERTQKKVEEIMREEFKSTGGLPKMWEEGEERLERFQTMCGDPFISRGMPRTDPLRFVMESLVALRYRELGKKVSFEPQLRNMRDFKATQGTSRGLRPQELTRLLEQHGFKIVSRSVEPKTKALAFYAELAGKQ